MLSLRPQHAVSGFTAAVVQSVNDVTTRTGPARHFDPTQGLREVYYEPCPTTPEAGRINGTWEECAKTVMSAHAPPC